MNRYADLHEIKNRKAQAATEYLIMTAVIIGASVLLFYYAMFFSYESIAVDQAIETAQTLAKAADYVYALGPGSKTIVEVYIPSSAVECAAGKVICAGEGEVGLKISTSAGVSDVYAATRSNVSGNVSYKIGRYYIVVSNTESGVEIGS